MEIALPPPVLPIVRGLWILLGCTALILAGIGVVLPLLPTTPFVILAAFAFGKGSTRLQRMLEEHRTFGPIIADWREHGVIENRYKIMAIGMMAAALLLSIALSLPLRVLVVQAVCMTGAAAFILSRPGRR